MTAPPPTARVDTAAVLNRVPEVTLLFWVIKILATTIGETAADFLDTTLGFGLTVTTLVMAVGLAAALVVQFRARRYVPWRYWLVVVLISVVGTLVTDNLTDNLGVDLAVTTTVFAAALVVTFVVWHRREHTLSIHHVDTPSREGFYWLAVLVTFALGTAAGDLLSERASLGYLGATLVFGSAIAVVALLFAMEWLNPTAAFWMAYVLTRPLGASIGDLLSQPRDEGGLGLGSTGTSALFLAVIGGIVVCFTVSARRSRDGIAPGTSR